MDAHMTTTIAGSCAAFLDLSTIGKAFAVELAGRPGGAYGQIYAGDTGSLAGGEGGAQFSVEISPTTIPHKSWVVATGLTPFGGIVCKTTMTVRRSWGDCVKKVACADIIFIIFLVVAVRLPKPITWTIMSGVFPWT